jgi:hypothetical protein
VKMIPNIYVLTAAVFCAGFMCGLFVGVFLA